MSNPGIKLPVRVEDITADWLGEALSVGHPGVAVRSARAVDVLWGTGTKVRLQVEYNDKGRAAGLPPILIVKGGFAEHRELMEECYLLEVRFYRDLLPQLGLNAPKAYFAGDDAANKQHIVIMEDLNLRGVTFCRVQNHLTFA